MKMNKKKEFDFGKVSYKFRAKNGTVFLNSMDQVYIERKGWFDYPYQFFTRGETLFSVDEIGEIVIKEPDMVRGYMDFILKDGRKARVWLTHLGYMPMARKMEKMITARMNRSGKKRNGLRKTDQSPK